MMHNTDETKKENNYFVYMQNALCGEKTPKNQTESRRYGYSR